MAQNVKSMGTKIDSVLKAIKEISEENKAILTRQTSLEKVVNDLKDQNEILKNQNNQFLAEIELTKRNVTMRSIPGPSDATGSLVIGSSLIQNFDETKLPNHTVCCMPGAYMADVEKKLQNYAAAGSRFRAVTIVAGGNDCSLPPDRFNISDISATTKSAVNVAKPIADQVMVSAILPRMQPQHALTNVKTLNGSIKSLCDNMSVKFADHDDHFYLKNGSVNECYFHDSVHLTVKGANKLASSLGLMTVTEDPKVGVCSYKPTQSFCFDHKSSLSSDTDFSHSFWNTAKRKFNNTRKQNNERYPTQQTTPSGHPKRATHTAGNFPATGRGGTLPQSRSHQQPRPEMRSGQRWDERVQQQLQHGQRAWRQVNGFTTHRKPHHPYGGSMDLKPQARPLNQTSTSTSGGRGTFPRTQFSTPNETGRPGQPRRVTDQAVDTIPSAGQQQMLYQRPLLSRQQSLYSSVMKADHGYCTYCDELNHRDRSCKHGQPIKCFSSNREGHKARDCPSVMC